MTPTLPRLRTAKLALAVAMFFFGFLAALSIPAYGYDSSPFSYDGSNETVLTQGFRSAIPTILDNRDFARGSSSVHDSPRYRYATNGLGALDDAAFAQTTFRESFSAGGSFAGQTIDDVAAGLRSGALSAGDVPIQVIVRDGNTLILNTRSAQALTRAGIPRSDWLTVNMTGNAAAEARLTAQLARNGLDNAGFLNPLSTGK